MERRGYELLGLALLGLLMHAPVSAANTAPVCADVSATVQNVDAQSSSGGGAPWTKIAAACTDPDPGTTLQYALNGPPPLGSWGGDPAGFVYSPKYLFSGTDTFDYVAFDGIDVSHAATVTITVLAPPVVDRDPDRDGVDDEFDGCPDQAGAGRPDGCPDRDGDGVPEYDDACPDVAAAGRDDGCPPVVDERAWAEATRRQARRLGRHWHRPAERAAAWRTGHIAMMVHVPNDAATGRQLRVGARVQPVRQPRDGPLPSLMFAKGVRCEAGQSCRLSLHIKRFGFRFARHRPIELQLTVSPHDGHGAVSAVARLRLSPRR